MRKPFLSYQIDLRHLTNVHWLQSGPLAEMLWDNVACQWDVHAHDLQGPYGVPYYWGDMLKIARKEIGIRDNEVLRHKAQLNEDMERSLDDAFRANYEDELYEYIVNAIEEKLTDFNFYWHDAKGNKCETYEMDGVTITMTRDQFRQLCIDHDYKDEYTTWVALYDDPEAVLDNYIHNDVLRSSDPLGLEFFDYHGTRPYKQYEGWELYFTEHSEALYNIKKERSQWVTRLKTLIQNKVPLPQRQSILQQALGLPL